MNKLLMFLMMGLFIIPLSFADIYQANTTVTFYSDLYNGSLQYLPDNQSVSTYIYDLNNSLVSSGNMILQTVSASNRTSWAFNTTIYGVGDYYRLTDYFAGNVLVAQSSETFRIVTNINEIAQDSTNMLQTIFQTFIIFLVGFLIAVLGKWLREPVFYFFSGVYFMGSSTILFFTGQGWTFPLFFMLFGFVVIYKGISEFIIEADLKEKRSRENPFDEIE